VAEETSDYLAEKKVDIEEICLKVGRSLELINTLATKQCLALQACFSILREETIKVSTGHVHEV